MSFRAVILVGFIFAVASGQELREEAAPLTTGAGLEVETVKPANDFVLRPKPWWLRISTKKWQWVTINPKIYYPPERDPLKYTAIIEHEKVHLSQQRKTGKYKWLFKYIASKKFRFEQEMEPIVVELLNTPPEFRKQLAVKYANNLSGAPYSRAAKSFDVALDGILSKAEEMGVKVY